MRYSRRASSALTLISIDQLLDLWSDLEQAYHGTNGFGGHVAEIYAYRFQRYNPARTSMVAGKMKEDADREAALDAAATLWALLAEFARRRECRVDVVSERDKWREIGPWLGRTPFVHRVHVRVTPKRAHDCHDGHGRGYMPDAGRGKKNP